MQQLLAVYDWEAGRRCDAALAANKQQQQQQQQQQTSPSHTPAPSSPPHNAGTSTTTAAAAVAVTPLLAHLLFLAANGGGGPDGGGATALADTFTSAAFVAVARAAAVPPAFRADVEASHSWVVPEGANCFDLFRWGCCAVMRCPAEWCCGLRHG